MGKTTHCRRCGDLCLAVKSDKPSARPFRRSLRGLCSACVVCRFFQDRTGEFGIGFALPPHFNPEGLLLPHVQEQFARVLAVGRSELRIDDIDWVKVIEKWKVGRGAEKS